MQLRIEKAKPEGEAQHSTSNPEAQKAPDITARMHFYAVRNAGDQLRWTSTPRTGKKPDRMVGR
ncbi:MAG TPA: hypothetical protein VND41_03650 [Nitrososphaerales archaeon]|nr:hypothetical protein [Nitrososphaerales archaeon]